MKAYHFWDIHRFDILRLLDGNGELTTEQQLSIGDEDDEPRSVIKFIKKQYYKGFDKYIINHEKVKRKYGRAYGEDLLFNRFIESNSMNAYYHPEHSLLLIEGNKGSVNGFVKKLQKVYPDSFMLARSSVDFPYLIEHSTNVWGGWLNGFNDGGLKSVALFGDHVNLSEDYNRLEAAGKLSSLNCSISFEKTNYDFTITANKTVVIMQNRTPEQDLDLLLFLKPILYKELTEKLNN